MENSNQISKMSAWKIRIAPSLGGGFDGTPQERWGVEEYTGEGDTVFFGLYGLPDFYTLWRHKGRKCILWAGSDIKHFKNGYWLDKEGWIKLNPTPLAFWIRKECESYVENEVEQRALLELGIESKVIPSFLGDTNKYEVTFKPSDRPKLYTSVSGDDFKTYGWDKIPQLASENPDIEFHLYGSSTTWASVDYPNVFIHGRVPIEQMNAEIKEMQGCLRLTEFDGFSEIVAKALLMGQYPVSLIKYPHTFGPEEIDNIRHVKQPNLVGREWLLSVVNKYPWNTKS